MQVSAVCSLSLTFGAFSWDAVDINKTTLLKFGIGFTSMDLFCPFKGLTSTFALQGGWVMALGDCGELCKH